MSRKKREERIRAAEEKKKNPKPSSSTAAQLDQMVSGLDVAVGPTRWWAKIVWFLAGKKWLLAILAVLLAGGVIFGVCTLQQYRMRTIPGRPIGELVVATPTGGVVVLMDYVAIGGGKNSTGPTTKGHRLTAIDGATGKQLAVDVPDHQKCWAGGTRMWCLDEYRRLVLLDPRTLETVATAEKLIAAAKLAKPTDRYDTNGEDVIVHLSDGRGARISGTTLAVSVLESIPWQQHRFEDYDCDKTSRITLGSTTLILDSGGTRSTLRSDPPPPAESATPQGPALTFLDGGFLEMWPPLPIVLQRALVDGPQILTRVDGISRAVWSVPLGGTCRLTQVVGPTLFVATSNPEYRALAIDVETGGVRWAFGR